MQTDTQTITQTNTEATEERVEMDTLNFRLPVALRRRMRVLAAELDMTNQEAGIRAIELFVAEAEAEVDRRKQ